jgi:arginase family enzyme
LRGASAGIHLSFDLDACDPALAPGVTTPVQDGLDRREALAICEQLGRSGRLSSLEIVELNPAMDAGNRTAELAARLVESALAAEPAPGPRLGATTLTANSHSPAREDLEWGALIR